MQGISDGTLRKDQEEDTKCKKKKLKRVNGNRG